MSELRPLRSRTAELLHSLRGQWWGHLLIAGSLLVVFGDFDDPPRTLAVIFAANLLVSVSIGMATTAVYVFGWGTVLIEGSALRRALVHGVSIVVGVAVGAEIAIGVLQLIAFTGFELSVARQGLWQVGGVITAAVMIGSVTVDRMRERIRAVEMREQQAQQALLRAQIDSLQARVNPHFLFNALNTVACLIEDDPEAAVEGVERLSSLLRYSLEGARQGRVPLSRELEAVHSYLALEELRFGERLRSRVEVAPGLGSIPVPPFVLQPLVENAVKHGIGPRRGGGRVEVTVTADETRLCLRVQDDGPGVSDEPGTQTGHDNLRRRLDLLYGDDARFEAGPMDDGGGYRVRIELPRARAVVDPTPSPREAEAEPEPIHQPAAEGLAS
ncbi:MAG: histidine kinase [Nannocystaceae bacterium]